MRKKGFVILLFLIVLSLFFISAVDETVEQKAYSCLENKIEKDKCASLSTEEKIFSLLSIGKCKSELLGDASNNQCWPKGGCKVKTTAQAILALNSVGYDTSQAENWLLSKNATFSENDWFLQVDSTNETSCTATYSGSTYSFSVNEDKTLSKNAGSCLTKFEDYWFKISSSCFSRTFEISCSDSFLTSILYRKEESSTFFISDKTNSASKEGKTSEQIHSFCFTDATSCNYEGTLWAALVLDFLEKDVSSFTPYLISMADENSKYIPESFLYMLTDDYRTDLLTKQKENKWWAESGEKFYDTAVALLPFQNEESLLEKTNSINWLTEIQDDDGCWQGNIRDTAFLLYSLWPKTIILDNVSESLDCEDSNYFCMSKSSCSGISGEELENYKGCFGTNICCNKNKLLESCSEQNGELCSSGEECLGGDSVSSSDSTSSKICCIDGDCGISITTECEDNGNTCKNSCSTQEQISSYSCPSSQVCCSPAEKNPVNILVIVILLILISLVVLGIIFRNKIREFFFRFKGKGKLSPAGGPRFPPTSSSKISPNAIPRRIIQNPPQRVPLRPSMKNNSEFDDVLKKLKEIGK
jgi:hypothetical protein